MLHQPILRTRLLVVIGLSVSLVLMLSVLSPTSSTVQALPPRPTPVLTMTPTSLPLPDTRQGGLIELRVQPAQSSVWTIIQWQGANGQWHDVDGWQGTLTGDRQLWWVAPADLGKGPFRWQVYQSRGGKLLAESKPFSLPGLNRETVYSEVTLTP
jgi:hypothetical protein